MNWPSWLRARRRRPAASASLTACPDCGREMTLVERTTFTGDDMRTYRCERCNKDHIVNYGEALWKILSDARNSDKGSS